MSFIGKNGFFGAIEPYHGHYHHSVYAKYSRGGGSQNGAGTLGKAFAYTRPKFSGGGAPDNSDPTDFDSSDPVFNQPQQQPRQPGLQERVFKFLANRDQLYAGSPFNISAETAQLAQQSDDYQKDTANYADDLRKDAEDVQKRAQGGNVMPRYNKPPRNSANNDHHQGHTAGRGGSSYSWGKVSPHFQNEGAEVTPHGHNRVTPRRDAKGRFARGGQAKMTPVWKDRPFAVSQSTKMGQGVKIHAPHSGQGLVMNIHLGPVGPHAISLQHSGAVNNSNSDFVRSRASHALRADARPSPFPVPQAPAVVPMGPQGFQALLGKPPYS